ncbi:hypothetical protein FHL15_009266 [Xylaria flabelliformis]|uniref:Sm protein F n=1 Tax=Xylaria flabelliformis TaxID=2512241 RepID=A0A553HPF1_9PEZI|nr:hypothetical protein FHL15_009266 [Xylaria flabelliformis]
MYALTLTAELNGVTSLRPKDTEATPFWYTFTVQCTSCRETHPNAVSVSRFETNELSGSRGEANFVWKCKNCKRESSASIKIAPKPYELSEPPKQQTVIEFDCRGLEFTSFSPEGEWLAEGAESGTKFEGIELQEGEWFDYDEKANDEFMPVNPRPMLQDLVNKDIVVRLKWGETEYKGRLVSIDGYFNIQLTNAQEYIDQKFTSDLGQILIRCNNVLWIKRADEKGDVAMEG